MKGLVTYSPTLTLEEFAARGLAAQRAVDRAIAGSGLAAVSRDCCTEPGRGKDGDLIRRDTFPVSGSNIDGAGRGEAAGATEPGEGTGPTGNIHDRGSDGSLPGDVLRTGSRASASQVRAPSAPKPGEGTGPTGTKLRALNPTRFLCRSEVRSFLLEFARANRAHRFERVSEETLREINEHVRQLLIAKVRRLPSKGKTI